MVALLLLIGSLMGWALGAWFAKWRRERPLRRRANEEDRDRRDSAARAEGRVYLPAGSPPRWVDEHPDRFAQINWHNRDRVCIRVNEVVHFIVVGPRFTQVAPYTCCRRRVHPEAYPVTPMTGTVDCPTCLEAMASYREWEAGRSQMDALERQQMLELLGRALDLDHDAVGEFLRRDLERQFQWQPVGGEQDQQRLLAEVGNTAQRLGFPVANLRFEDSGRTIAFDTLDFSGMEPNRG